MKRKLPVMALLAGAVAFACIQLVPAPRTNPPVETEITAPAQVRAILRQACYDCHSNRTLWPWYARVAPVSWLVANDVKKGREEVNFTAWNRYTADEQATYRKEVWKQVERDRMPPRLYRFMHPEARLSAEQKAIVREWSATTTGGNR